MQPCRHTAAMRARSLEPGAVIVLAKMQDAVADLREGGGMWVSEGDGREGARALKMKSNEPHGKPRAQILPCETTQPTQPTQPTGAGVVSVQAVADQLKPRLLPPSAPQTKI